MGTIITDLTMIRKFFIALLKCFLGIVTLALFLPSSIILLCFHTTRLSLLQSLLYGKKKNHFLGLLKHISVNLKSDF